VTENSSPSVTVALAAFNAVPFISRAVMSALNQLDVSVEVIVVDDASTDDTVNFVESEFEAEPRVRVIKLSKNSGPAAARNAAFAEAKGRWIAVLDADDAFEPNHLKALIELGESTSADMIAGNFAYFDVHRNEGAGIGLERRTKTETLNKYSFVQGARPYTKEADFGLLKPLFRLSFLRSQKLNYPIDVRHGEDMELVLDALLKGARYVLDRNICTYLYTMRDSGHSRTPVNYGAQVKRTLSLADRADVRDDERLRTLLIERADSLRLLELNRNWMSKTMSRRKIVWSCLHDPAGRRWLLSRTIKKLVRRRSM
jgi:succinoglycan biosynthesis protein ExoO